MCSYTQKLIANNRKWAFEQSALPSQPLIHSSKKQSPNTLWIGCSDSRVPPELLTQQSIGDVFVHRNIANQICTDDLNVMSVLEYAVNHLRVQHIVVCGHYSCGGVQSVVERSYTGLIKQWLNNLDDLYLSNRSVFEDMSIQQAADKMCELNVINQTKNLVSFPLITTAKNNNQNLTIHSMIYDLSSGKLNDLELSCSSLEEFNHQLLSKGYHYNLS